MAGVPTTMTGPDPNLPDEVSTMCLLDCMPDNPFRAPDYRWARACYLRERRGRLSPKWDDHWVRRAREFRRRLARYKGDIDHPRLGRLDPAVAGAHRLRFGDDEKRRSRLEARIVSGQPAGEIAERAGLTLDVVEAYEALFFAVRDRLECADWVAAFVLGSRLHEGFAVGDEDFILKLYAYNFGPYFLDLVLDSIYGGSTGTDAADTDFTRRFAATFRLAVAIRSIPVTPEAAPKFVMLFARLEEIERMRANGRVDAVSGDVGLSPVDLSRAGLAATRNRPEAGGEGVDWVGDGEVEPITARFPSPSIEVPCAEGRRTG
jgi:hypothetical protein